MITPKNKKGLWEVENNDKDYKFMSLNEEIKNWGCCKKGGKVIVTGVLLTAAMVAAETEVAIDLQKSKKKKQRAYDRWGIWSKKTKSLSSNCWAGRRIYRSEREVLDCGERERWWELGYEFPTATQLGLAVLRGSLYPAEVDVGFGILGGYGLHGFATKNKNKMEASGLVKMKTKWRLLWNSVDLRLGFKLRLSPQNLLTTIA